MQSQTTSEVKKVYKLSKLPIIINCLDKNIFAMPAKSYKRDKDETAAVRQISKKKTLHAIRGADDAPFSVVVALGSHFVPFLYHEELVALVLDHRARSQLSRHEAELQGQSGVMFGRRWIVAPFVEFFFL